MPKGGARARSGPPPSMQALKRERDSKTFTRLPKECTRPAPPWPEEIILDPSDTELNMWDKIWSMPQAHVWHADHLYDSVALYVRQFVEAAKPRAGAQLRSNVRMLQTELLLTTSALTSQRYLIVGSAEDEILQDIMNSQELGQGGAPDAPHPGPQPGSVRERFRVVGSERTGTE